MKIDITQFKKECYLYIWLTQFLNKTNDEGRIKLENEACGRRKEDFERIQLQLDIFNSLEKKFTLNEYETVLYEDIRKQMSFKNRKNLDISKLKTDVCEFLLRLDNPFSNNKEYQSMTSILYTQYPDVHKRVKNNIKNTIMFFDDQMLYEYIYNFVHNNEQKKLTKQKNVK